MNNTDVIIVDSNEERANRNAQSFLGLDNISVYIVLNQSIKSAIDDKEIEDINIENRLFLVFIHNNDYATWEILCHNKQGLDFLSFVIRFTGDYQDSLHIEGQEWINRSINLDTTITKEEAKNIFSYFHCCQENTKVNCSKPLILSKSLHSKYLPSLSILCQGYLATNSKSVDKKVKEALDQMGWNKEIHPDISNKKLETQKTSWWLEPFDNEPVDAIIAKVKKEWRGGKDGEIPNSVTEFLKRIEQDKLQYPDSTAIVANAYLAIAARLETE